LAVSGKAYNTITVQNIITIMCALCRFSAYNTWWCTRCAKNDQYKREHTKWSAWKKCHIKTFSMIKSANNGINILIEIKGIVHKKRENSVIIYSPSSCSKPVWFPFFCWTQKGDVL